MTQDEIIEMAKEAGFLCLYLAECEKLEALVKLVAAKEREACAMVCDTEWDGDADTFTEAETSNALAAAIRARGQA